MADKPSTTKVSLTNSAEGPRSFFDADRNQHILRPGESWEGSILAADKGDLSSDLTGGGGEAKASGGGERQPKPKAKPEVEFKSLDGLTRDGLLTVATEEGFATIAASDDAVSDDEIRKAIELARQSSIAQVQAEADALEKANSAAQLRELADKEEVEYEGDANKGTIAFNIAYARYLKAQGS